MVRASVVNERFLIFKGDVSNYNFRAHPLKVGINVQKVLF